MAAADTIGIEIRARADTVLSHWWVDPIVIGSHLILALQHVAAR